MSKRIILNQLVKMTTSTHLLRDLNNWLLEKYNQERTASLVSKVDAMTELNYGILSLRKYIWSNTSITPIELNVIGYAGSSAVLEFKHEL
jgi:hypothetical protein